MEDKPEEKVQSIEDMLKEAAIADNLYERLKTETSMSTISDMINGMSTDMLKQVLLRYVYRS